MRFRRMWGIGQLDGGHIYGDTDLHGGMCPITFLRIYHYLTDDCNESQPERIAGSDYTVRSDVWSTGISLLELVQNRFPFPSDLPAIEFIVTITTGEVI